MMFAGNKRVIVMRRTAVALVALCAAFAAPAAFAQSSAIKVVYDDLILLQDANLGIARQMAALEQQAANELETALQSGRIGLPAHQAIARTFVANARTLAAIMLSPMQTYQTAAGESMFILLRRNIELLRGVMPNRAADPALDAAITRYTVLQMQTQDMAEALQNGWTRYASILKSAEQSGLLAANTFDPDTQSWSLGTPVAGTATMADLPAAPAPAPEPAPGAGAEFVVVPDPLPEPAVTTATEVAAVSEPQLQPEIVAEPGPAPEPAAERPVTPEPPDLASTVTPLVVPDMPPAPRTTLAEVPRIEDMEEPEETAAGDARLPAAAPLEVAPGDLVTTAMGDWIVVTKPDGETIATSTNLVGDTRSMIATLSMACTPDRSVAYVITGAQEYPAFRIYADRSQSITVNASSNVVMGPEAEAMATTLGAAVEWAQQVPDSGRSLSVRSADSSGVLALFPPSGYVEARAAMEAACEREPAVAVAGPEMVTELPQDPVEPETAVAEPEEPVAEPPPEEPAEVAGPVAPVPRPPLDRSQLPAAPPTQFQPQTPPVDNSQPVSLM